MVDDLTQGGNTTITGARVGTLVVAARQILGTVRVNDTLRLAGDVGVAEVAREASAFHVAVQTLALRVGSAYARQVRYWS